MATAPVDIPVRVKGLAGLQKLEKRMEDIERDVSKLTKNLPGASNNIRRMGAAGRTAAKGIEKATKAAKAADTQFGKLGKSALIAFKGFIAFQGLRFLVNSAAEIERVQVQLTTLTGSLNNAKIIYEELDRINKKSPFGTQELVSAAATLRGFGIRLENLVSTTESLGKISAATGRDIQGIALAYGQVRAKGRLMGEELLQFQERGIPLVAELAKQLGVQEDAIAGMVSKGKIGFKEVQTAIKNLTGETGKFADAFDNTADTTFARLSNFQDALKKLAASVFSLFEPVFTWVVENLTTILNLIETAVKRFQRVQQLTPEALQGFRNQAADEANEKFGFFDLSGAKSDFFNKRLNELVDGATGGKITLDLSFDAPELPKLPGLNDGTGTGTTVLTEAEKKLNEQLKIQRDLVNAVNGAYSKRQEAIGGLKEEIQFLENAVNYGEEYAQKFREIQRLVMEGVPFSEAFDLVKAKYDLQGVLDGVNDITDQSKILDDVWNGFGNEITGVLDKLISGTEDWNSVLTDTLRSLSSLLLKAGLNALGGSDGKGFFSILSGNFGGGKAKGGPVTGGTSYIVGEQGPELFTPGRSGTITPNSAMGGDVNVITNINVEKGTSSSTSSGDSKEAAQLARMMENATMAVINRERRPGGILNR